jgi:3-hydroxyacyl-CoA dehydrogenase
MDMNRVNGCVSFGIEGAVGLIAMDNPPVNALKHELREGVAQALEDLRNERSLRAVVLAGSERAFSAGADLTEFGKPPRAPMLPDLIKLVEDFPKPVVAAIKGIAMGGGLELALGCHYRVGWKGARLALPEIKLGLLPGAGGTQRLPRLVGFAAALDAILSGDPMAIDTALGQGLLDAVLDGAYPAAAIAWAAALDPALLPRARDREAKLAEVRANPGLIAELAGRLAKKDRAAGAVRACVEAVRAAATLPIDEGLALERKLFLERMTSDESKALRYAFFAEREANKVPGLGRDVAARAVKRAAVIGAGTMGGGIAMCFANAGIPVTLIEVRRDALDAGLARIAKNYETSVKRGSLEAGEAARRQGRIAGAVTLEAAAEADFVIEAVFEELELKKQVFGELDRIARQGAVLATNTSYLDVNVIAAVTNRPGDVLGTHFFSPANVMRLLEVVRGAKTAPDALATAVELGRALGKVPVVVGVCDGFVGNRMLARRSAQAERLLLEGALPQEVDKALTDFGFRMGPCAMGDLAGLDIGWRLRQARGLRAEIADALVEAGRLGQKTGKGYYLYAGDGRTPTFDPEVEALIVAASARLGIARRAIGADEILERLLYPMISEGARILDEGIAARPGDIDVIWLNGYGWPAASGGPMYYADQVGLGRVAARLVAYARASGDETLRPSPLLVRLAEAGKGFASVGVTAEAAQ